MSEKSSLPIGPAIAGVAVVLVLAVMLVLDGRQRVELRRNAAADPVSGLTYGKFFPAAPAAGPTQEQEEMFHAVGYNAGYEQAPTQSGVTVYNKERAQPGLNLVLTGHAPEAALLDMEGRALHTWAKRLEDVWPEPRVPAKGSLTFAETVRAQPDIDPKLVRRLPKHFLDAPNHGHSYYRRAYLYPNGDLLTFFSYIGAVKLDRASNVVWSHPMMAHHDLDVGPDGRVYMIAMEPRALPGMGEGGTILSDYVAVFSDDGRLERKIDVLDAFLNSSYAGLVTRVPQQFDLLHTNTVTLLDGTLADRIPAFRAGNLLISCRNVDTIAVIDPEQARVVWAMKGPFVMQHDPIVLDSGTILLFDNQGHGGYSRIVEFDPITQEIAWEFSGSPPESFYSTGLGAVTRLANGNTLITESTRGRAFELTPDKAIVWEYVNPHRAGEHDELIAVVFDVVRLPQDYADAWLAATDSD